jgi:KRAB domain-containing zinc finger protein
MPKRINCNSCANQFTISQLVNNVCLACRVVDEYLAAENANLSNKKPKLTAETPIFACGECPLKFSIHQAWEEHVIENHDPSTYKPEEHICIKCWQDFKTKAQLNRHIKINHNPPQFSCEYCSKKFFYDYLLVAHTKSAHLNEKSFKCTMPDCHESFSIKVLLNNHIERIHNKNYTIKCDNCEYKCYNKNELKLHTAMHLRSTDERPHKCDICKIPFKYENHLKQHKKACLKFHQ